MHQAHPWACDYLLEIHRLIVISIGDLDLFGLCYWLAYGRLAASLG
jgi:hypothetical protein